MGRVRQGEGRGEGGRGGGRMANFSRVAGKEEDTGIRVSGCGGLRGVLYGGEPKKNFLGKMEILGGEEQEEGSQPMKRREGEEDHAVETVAAAGRQFDNQVSNMISFLIFLSWFPDKLGCHTLDTR